MNALRAFEAVSRMGSVKHAADELCVTPAAISQQIRKLEDDIGKSLFHRHHRGIELTDVGHRLSQCVVGAMNNIRSAIHEIHMDNGNGDVVISCPPSFCAKFLAPRLCEYRALHPTVSVHLATGLDEATFIDSNADIGIVFSGMEIPGTVSSKSFWEYQLPMATPEYLNANDIFAVEDIEKAVLLERDVRTIFPTQPLWGDWFDYAGYPKLRHQRQVDFGLQYDQAFDAAFANEGIIMGGIIATSKLLQSGRLVSPFGPPVPLGFGFKVIIGEAANCRPYVRALKDWIVSQLQDASRLVLQYGVVQSHAVKHA